MQRLGKKLGLIISCENLDAHFQAPPGLEGFRLRWVVFTNLECRIAISHIIAAVTSSGPGPSIEDSGGRKLLRQSLSTAPDTLVGCNRILPVIRTSACASSRNFRRQEAGGRQETQIPRLAALARDDKSKIGGQEAGSRKEGVGGRLVHRFAGSPQPRRLGDSVFHCHA
jgi:hypothetical protein